jgi:hypothetical protein
MKTIRLPRASGLSESAFTYFEMGVAMGVLGLLGGVFFSVLNSGMVLSAKNIAVNSAHQEARDGILRLTRDIHASVSVPQLRDTSQNVVSSVATTGPVAGSYVAPMAAGISFQNVFSGPNYVWKDPNNPNLIMIKDNPDKPVAGMRLIIPFFNLEEDITKVVANGNHHNVFIKADQSTPDITAPSQGSPYAILYYTDRVMYVVKNGAYVADPDGDWILSGGNYVSCRTYTANSSGEWILSNGVYVPYTNGTMQRYSYTNSSAQRYRYENGELHLYKQDYAGSSVYWRDVAVISRYISSPQPFYVPLNSGGTADMKYVGVRLTARDPKSSNRGYRATASLLDTQIDYRSRITLTQ